jgi:hypothetical protein
VWLLPDIHARATRGLNDAHACAMRGPDAPARATCGLGFTLHRVPLVVPAPTSAPRARTLSCRVVGLPPRRSGCDPRHTHPMVTRRAAGVTKHVDHLQLSAVAPPTLSPVPTSVRSALANPHRRHAMEEYGALLSNSTWNLVPRPPGANVVISKWIFKHKLKVDGSVDRYKTRWVIRGSLSAQGWTTTRPSAPSSSLPLSGLC